MVAMTSAQQQAYPQVAAFCQTQLSDAFADSRVLNAFTTHAYMTEQDARLAVYWTGGPILRIAEPSGPNLGWFDSAEPGNIHLCRIVARRFEEKPEHPLLCKVLESTILHEMVHWGEYASTGRLSVNPERGKLFEAAAYGHDYTFGDLYVGYQPVEDDPRGIRMNNPGNLRRTGDAWDGLVDGAARLPFQRNEQEFCVFENALYGLRAMMRQFKTNHENHNRRTVRAIISAWAPQNENDTAEYIGKVCTWTGFAAEQDIDVSQFSVSLALARAIVRMENGRDPYGEEEYRDAFEIARL